MKIEMTTDRRAKFEIHSKIQVKKVNTDISSSTYWAKIKATSTVHRKRKITYGSY